MTQSGNAALYFVDRHVEEGRGDKVAFREAADKKRTLTYAQLADASGRVASALKRHGIPREARAAMLVLDQIEFPEIFWGCFKAGVIAVPLNTLLATSVYEVILNDSRATILFVSEKLWPVVKDAAAKAPHLERIVVIGDTTPEGTENLADFIAGCDPAPAIAASIDDTAFWLYSSGSTGAPKGVRHVHGAMQATSDTYGAKVLRIEEGDTIFSAAKLFFAYGLGNGMTFPLSVGATSVLYNGRPTPESMTQVIEAERPTIFGGVPTLYAAMVAMLDNTRRTDSGLRRCISAGEALPEEIGRKWSEIWGVDILDGVGSTEMLHIFLSNAPDDVVYGTSGRAVPGYDLRLVDEAGADITEPGMVGELLVRGASAADGYWNKRDKSRFTFEGEWTRTGDKYELNAEGRYVYCGRTDDMFKVSGIWLSPFEVEQALIAHPNVLEAAVVAARDEEGLEKPKAFVVLKPGANRDALAGELKEFVKKRIGMWKYPRWIEFVDDLPKTATGKIQRFKLREGVLMPGLDWSAKPDAPLVVDGVALDYACYGPPPDAAPTVVLLHEGLGCAALWRDFPRRLAERTGLGVFVYSRQGYGQSDPVTLPRPLDFMTREAKDALPPLLDAIGFRRGILFGHSDGATIAAIHAGSVADPRVRGLILMAPHFFTESVGLAEIERARETFRSTDLRQKMAKYHRDPDGAFRGWNDVWLDPGFRAWNVADVIDYIRVPVLAIQGRDDQYGTLAQIAEIETRCHAPVDTAILADCRHAPHLEQPDATLAAAAEFCARLMRIEAAGPVPG